MSTDIITQTALLLSWDLPPLALPADVVTMSFTITWTRDTDVVPTGSGTILFVSGQLQGYLISGLVLDGLYVISVVAMYSAPMLTSSAAVTMGRTLDMGVGELQLHTILSLLMHSIRRQKGTLLCFFAYNYNTCTYLGLWFFL